MPCTWCALLVRVCFCVLQQRHLVANITHDCPQTDRAALPVDAFPPSLELLGSVSWYLLIRIVDISMDTHHPDLINDCLISIFTFLKEDDLIVASCVCKVSGVTACGSTSCGFERIVIVNVIGFVSRIGMKLQRLRGCGGEISLMNV